MSRFVLIDCEQDTPEWRAARAGRVTGSKANCVTAQSKEMRMRSGYRVQLVAERLTQEPQEGGYQSRDMEEGKALEPQMRLAYEARTGRFLTCVGFAAMTEMAAGCSPDGLIDEDEDGFGFIEGKCPKPTVHLEYLERNRVPPEYVAQCTHNLYVLGAAFVDFVSFCPKLPEHLRLLVVRMYRNEVDLGLYDTQIRQFLREVDDMEARLRARERLKVAA